MLMQYWQHILRMTRLLTFQNQCVWENKMLMYVHQKFIIYDVYPSIKWIKIET